MKSNGLLWVHGKKRYRYSVTRSRAGYLFILPSMTIFAVFVFMPLLISVGFSLLNFDMMFHNIDFRGISNYVKLFQDHRFYNSLWNTLYYTVCMVPIQIGLALMAAVFLASQSKINSFLKSIYFIPAICSMTIASMIWIFLLDKNMGMLSYLLQCVGLQLPELLKDPVWAMPTIIGVGVWKNFGFNMVILIAGIQGISDSYYEAASIDGAGELTKFTKITMPQLMPTLSFAVINSVISSFQVFDQVYIMTQGGPLFKTETVVQYIYNSAFKNYDMGYASAIAVILFLITMAVSGLMLESMTKNEDSLE